LRLDTPAQAWLPERVLPGGAELAQWRAAGAGGRGHTDRDGRRRRDDDAMIPQREGARQRQQQHLPGAAGMNTAGRTAQAGTTAAAATASSSSSSSSSSSPLSRPQLPLPLPSFRHVCCGDAHFAAVDAEGGLWTWGNGANGQLGHPLQGEAGFAGFAAVVRAPQRVVTLARQSICSAACGKEHTAAVDVEGGVWTWGKGYFGRLGHGDQRRQDLPRRLRTASVT
jgi:hypothetical protein